MCSCLTENFVGHWRAFTAPSAATAASTAGDSSTTGSSFAGEPAERKVLASATRGLACAVGKGGVSSVLEPYLARVVVALNHLVQPAGEGEKTAAAAAAARGGGSTSGSRSRSHGRGVVGRFGGGGLSPTRAAVSSSSSSLSLSSSLADPRTRVRLQALTLLEAMASKDAKSLYPHWALFFAPCSPGEEASGTGEGAAMVGGCLGCLGRGGGGGGLGETIGAGGTSQSQYLYSCSRLVIFCSV